MKLATFLLTLLALCSCRRPIPTAQESHAFPDKPPVIDAQPVDAKSYDAGYTVGYAAGAAAASPRAKVPSQDEARPLAIEAAGEDPARNKKWRDGWVGGYVEGFRTRALHTK